MIDPAISTAEDFAEPETKVVALPRPGPKGQPLAVKVKAVPVVELVQAMEGVPSLSRGAGNNEGEQTFEEARELIAQSDGPQNRIARAGIVAPLFWFDDKDDKAGRAPWANVHNENRAAIVAAIMELSGFSASPKAAGAADGSPPKPATGGAAEAESFREVAGG